MTNVSGTGMTFGLAFETSSAHGSIALGWRDRIVETRELSGPRRHAVDFLPTLDALSKAHGLEPRDIGVIYVSTGPGSFTGLRIGITVARMIAFASRAAGEHDRRREHRIGASPGASDGLSHCTNAHFDAGPCRVVGVPTLEVIAQNALDMPTPPDRVVVILDAKRGRVYTCGFVRRHDRYVSEGEPVEADPGVFLAEQARIGGSCAVLGEGVCYHRAAVESSGLPVLPAVLNPPRAETVYRLGAVRADQGLFTDARMLVPTYVRPPEAEEKWRMVHGQ